MSTLPEYVGVITVFAVTHGDVVIESVRIYSSHAGSVSAILALLSAPFSGTGSVTVYVTSSPIRTEGSVLSVSDVHVIVLVTPPGEVKIVESIPDAEDVLRSDPVSHELYSAVAVLST